MAYVNPSTQSIKTCFQSNYSLPYFQREYKWDPKHFLELLNDVQNAFLISFKENDGRSEVDNYAPYFLGSIITSSSIDGKKPLIDGQQRPTSIFIILAYLNRYCIDNNIDDAFDVYNLLGRTSFGKIDYSIQFSASRKSIFDSYLDKRKNIDDAILLIEDVPDIDDGDEKILEALATLDESLDSTVKEFIVYFIDYVVERVLLIDISVVTETEAHRVFVTMNDRGLRLGPIELLKGRILSKIESQTNREVCHKIWNETFSTLRTIDPEEDSWFFRSFFRAKIANDIRKKRDTKPQDFDLIGDAYHRWFEENTARLDLITADDYVNFVRRDIPKFAEIYSFISSAENSIIEGFESIYFNAVRKYNSQAMVLLSPIKSTDSTLQWKEKLALTSRFIDLMLTSRMIEGKQNTYDKIRYISFDLTLSIRDKEVDTLREFFRSEWNNYFISFDSLHKLKYSRTDSNTIRIILARIASFLEKELELDGSVGFVRYCRRDKGSTTVEIEHILKEFCDHAVFPGTNGFKDALDYKESRNFIGALTLLSRSRNRSLQDKPYTSKVKVYTTENVLTQTLTKEFYQNNPKVNKYLLAYPDLALTNIPDFVKDSIGSRARSYTEIAKRIWQAP